MSGILPPMAENRTSRLSGFYQKSIAERVAIVTDWAGLSSEEGAALEAGLQTAQADKMVENVIGRYSLPLGIATNFLINGKEYLIPMVVEEPSVVAAVSNAARIIRAGGGFRTGSTEPIMIAQIQLLEVADAAAAEEAILNAKAELMEIANTSPSIKARGGGPRDIQVRHLPGAAGDGGVDRRIDVERRAVALPPLPAEAPHLGRAHQPGDAGTHRRRPLQRALHGARVADRRA